MYTCMNVDVHIFFTTRKKDMEWSNSKVSGARILKARDFYVLAHGYKLTRQRRKP